MCNRGPLPYAIHAVHRRHPYSCGCAEGHSRIATRIRAGKSGSNMCRLGRYRFLRPRSFPFLVRGLTIHSSRRRFAARLNSGVRRTWKLTDSCITRMRLFASARSRWHSLQRPCGRLRRLSQGQQRRWRGSGRTTITSIGKISLAGINPGQTSSSPRCIRQTEMAPRVQPGARRAGIARCAPNNSSKPTPLRGAA